MTKEGNMTHLSKEKGKKIAQEMYWTQRRAQGYQDGEYCQRSGQDMPECHKVGMDEYSKGFRTGYYMQNDPDSESEIKNKSAAL